MSKEIWTSPAKASEPLRHSRGRRHHEDIRCESFFGLSQQEIEHVRAEARSRFAARGDREVARVSLEEMESEPEGAGSRFAPAGGAAEIAEVGDVRRVDGNGGIDPEQLEISVLEKGGHRRRTLAIMVRDGGVDDDPGAAQHVRGARDRWLDDEVEVVELEDRTLGPQLSCEGRKQGRAEAYGGSHLRREARRTLHQMLRGEEVAADERVVLGVAMPSTFISTANTRQRAGVGHLTSIPMRATMVPTMTLDRRELLKGLSAMAASAALVRMNGTRTLEAATLPTTELPRKQDFDFADGFTYINAAYTHPIPRPAADAARTYLAQRNKLAMPRPGSGGGSGEGFNAKALFAELINAKPTEIAYVPNTSTGENLVVTALGLDRQSDFNVVTDWLHFDGALVHLLELKRRGLDVRIVRPTADYRIDINDLARVIDGKTRLVELSSTAMYNGFQHDLEAVCQLAHGHGAYVYADIIHTAGAELFDVKASGVDFAACSSFKWLMGDYGLGFLYARDDLLDRIRRPLIGYYEADEMTGHEPPFDTGAAEPVSWTLKRDATGHFEAGSIGGALGAGLAASLAYVKGIGVANIQAYRKPMIEKLRAEVPRLGFTCVTPPHSTASIITFARKGLGASDVPKKLDRARVNVRIADNWMRVSPSIYNDMSDIDRLVEALT